MKLNNIHHSIMTGAALALTTLVSSCADFLSIDNYFTDELKFDSIFVETRYVQAYMWQIAAEFGDEGSIHQTSIDPGPLATDEAFTAFNTSAGYVGMSYVLGQVNASSLGSLGGWANSYRAIRKCNVILSRIDEARDMKTDERFEIIGYTRFMRAYAYYRMWRNMGPCVILGNDVVQSNESLEFYDKYGTRATYDETCDYICNELEEAAKYLPETQAVMDFGRPTKGAAYGLIARVRLYQASPQYNGGQKAKSYYADWLRASDGVPYINQTPKNERWAVAAAAAKRVMELKHNAANLYKLYTFEADAATPPLPAGVTSDPDYYQPWPVGAAGIDPFRSYSEVFTGEAIIPANNEYVWGRQSATLRDNTRMSFPLKNSGWNGMCVTQRVVDAYKMVDGSEITDGGSAAYPYSETGFSAGSSLVNFSGYKFSPTEEIYNMYVNREPRFYASIGFCGRYWPMLSSTSSGHHDQTTTYYFDSPNGRSATLSGDPNYPPTGYVITKFIHERDAWTGDNNRRMDKGWAMVRYADILLMYAEALNNVEGTYNITLGGETYTITRDWTEIRNAFNQVRHRAGIPGVGTTPMTVEAFQDEIVRERMVELLFENHRYYDVRRWGIYEEVESNNPIMGMNVDSNKDGFYRRTVPNTTRISSRVVGRKMVLLPLPLTEVRRIPSMEQNPGWEK